MSDSEIDMRPWVENWWKRTNNPTYAWEAISRSLNSDEAIPGWALAYLKDAANKMRLLGEGRDFRQEDLPRIEPNEAVKLVGEALGLWRGATKNAFSLRADDARKAYAALDDEYSGRELARGRLKQGHPITDDRADRLIQAGHKLNRPNGER